MTAAGHHAAPQAADLAAIRDGVKALCDRFPGEYWRAKDRERAYPGEFVQALTEAGYLACLIPEEYGGSGLGISAAAAILEEIHNCGSRPSASLSRRRGRTRRRSARRRCLRATAPMSSTARKCGPRAPSTPTS